VRGKKISMIFQDPLSSLDPCYTVEDQIGEALISHGMITHKTEIPGRVLELLKSVGIPHPEQRLNSFPHELSGGMSQRVMIAIAIACRPDLLIADEPTTALDVTVQAQILALIGKLREERKMGLILVSHDLGMISQHTDRIAVMYAGEVVEEGKSAEILASPKHPYTKALLKSSPGLAEGNSKRLATISGMVPDLRDRPLGCQFSPRCTQVQEACRASNIPLDSKSNSRCLFV